VGDGQHNRLAQLLDLHGSKHNGRQRREW
jgi:hypothetical protein